MAESNRGGRAVVVDNAGRLRGIITRTDLLRQVGACVVCAAVAVCADAAAAVCAATATAGGGAAVCVVAIAATAGGGAAFALCFFVSCPVP